MPPDDVTAAAPEATPGAMTEFEAQSWPIEDAAAGLAQVIEGFGLGDTRPLVIGDGERPVLVLLAIGDLADFRARVTHLMGSPVDAGWFRYHLRSINEGMSPEQLVELLGIDTDHGLTSLASQVTVDQAAVLLPDHLRRAEEGSNPLMLIGDGRMAAAALVAYEAFAVLLDMDTETPAQEEEFEPDLTPTGLEELANQLGPVSVQIVQQINADKDSPPAYNLNFEPELIEHLTDLEARAQAAPGGGAYEELRATLRYLDELRTGAGSTDGEAEAPYLEAVELPGELATLREHFRSGADDPFLIGIEGLTLAGLISWDVYLLLQQISVSLGGTPAAPVLPLPGGEGPPLQPFDSAAELCTAVVDDIAAGEGTILFIADDEGAPELVLAPLQWLWAYVDYLEVEEAEA